MDGIHRLTTPDPGGDIPFTPEEDLMVNERWRQIKSRPFCVDMEILPAPLPKQPFSLAIRLCFSSIGCEGTRLHALRMADGKYVSESGAILQVFFPAQFRDGAKSDLALAQATDHKWR
jgi:hypothetical protein